MKRHIGVLLVLSIAVTVLGKPQISFGEEEEALQPSNPVSPEEPTSGDSLDNDELIQTRLGLLAGYLSKLTVYIFVNKCALLYVQDALNTCIQSNMET